MRWKIIVVNAGILLVVGLLAYTLLYTSLRDALVNPRESKRDVERDLRAARSELSLDAVRLERWLSRAAEAESIKGLFAQGLRDARAEAATVEANRLRDEVSRQPELAGIAPNLVLFVDEQGIALARNASALMRGENLGAAYPSLLEALRASRTESAVWYSRERQEQLLVSVAPVRAGGRTVGALIVGTALSDERMARVSELVSGQALFFAVVGPKGLDVLAGSNRVDEPDATVVTSTPVLAAARAATTSAGFAAADLAQSEQAIGTAALVGYTGQKAVLIGAKRAGGGNLTALLAPVIGVFALGLLMIIVAGTLLGNYISEPISELEDGLLSVINGNSSLRFQVEHDELGGLVFRINSLLNQMMGVPEDTTDEQGRPSQGPRAQDFQEALSVDESAVLEQTDPRIAGALAVEPADAYYGRLFKEYVSAKRQLGDPTDHITLASFRERISASEQEMSAKHGRPVRFEVQLRNQGIVLNAIPLGSGPLGSGESG